MILPQDSLLLFDARAGLKLKGVWALFSMLARKNNGRGEIDTRVSLALNDQSRICYDPFLLILRMLGVWYIDMNKFTLFRC